MVFVYMNGEFCTVNVGKYAIDWSYQNIMDPSVSGLFAYKKWTLRFPIPDAQCMVFLAIHLGSFGGKYTIHWVFGYTFVFALFLPRHVTLRSWAALLTPCCARGTRTVGRQYLWRSTLETWNFPWKRREILLGCPRKLGSMVRTNGLFHLLINGGWSGGISHLLIFLGHLSGLWVVSTTACAHQKIMVPKMEKFSPICKSSM